MAFCSGFVAINCGTPGIYTSQRRMRSNRALCLPVRLEVTSDVHTGSVSVRRISHIDVCDISITRVPIFYDCRSNTARRFLHQDVVIRTILQPISLDNKYPAFAN